MCLYNSSEEKIATEDIVCWKRLCEAYDNEFNSSLLHVESKSRLDKLINDLSLYQKIINES